MTTIPHSRPTLGQIEIKAVSDVIESARIAQGKMVKKFEKAFAGKMDIAHAVCTNSGTSALHLTLVAMGIGSTDEVIIPSHVCTALLNAVKYAGAMPILADIDPVTLNLDPVDVKKRLTSRTRAVIVPHMFGLAANMDELLNLNVPIIEDCAQAVGTTYRHKHVGTFGHAAVFSFYATKVMTTGEGGMVVSDSKELIECIRDLREYDNKNDYKIRYNYKMTDIHAALGLSQLARLQQFIRIRKDIAEKYHQAFKSLDIHLPPQDPGHIYFRYIIGLENDSSPLISSLQKKGVGCAKPVHLPIHLHLKLKGYPRTETAWNQSLSIPIYPSLSEKDINRVMETFIDVYNSGRQF